VPERRVPQVAELDIIASSAYDGRPDGTDPVSGDGAGRLVPLAVPPANLLRSDSAARIVLGLLESGSHARPPAGAGDRCAEE
jgi:hypothetical protein